MLFLYIAQNEVQCTILPKCATSFAQICCYNSLQRAASYNCNFYLDMQSCSSYRFAQNECNALFCLLINGNLSIPQTAMILHFLAKFRNYANF